MFFVFLYFLVLVKAVLKKREYGPKYTQNNFITGVRAINEFCLKARYSFVFFFKIFFFRQRGKEGEKHLYETETSVGLLSHVP